MPVFTIYEADEIYITSKEFLEFVEFQDSYFESPCYFLLVRHERTVQGINPRTAYYILYTIIYNLVDLDDPSLIFSSTLCPSATNSRQQDREKSLSFEYIGTVQCMARSRVPSPSMLISYRIRDYAEPRTTRLILLRRIEFFVHLISVSSTLFRRR